MALAKLPKKQEIPEETNKPTAASERAVDAFINRAPDGVEGKKIRGNRKKSVLITITLDPELLSEFDALVEDTGISRASAIKALLRKAVKNGSLL